MNFNQALILGNVTRDPEIRKTQGGTTVASFSIATNRFYKDQGGEKKQETEFHNVVAFGKLAELIERYVQKGGLLLIKGRIRTRNYQNQSGQKVYRTEIVAEEMQLGPRPAGSAKSHKEYAGEATPEELREME
ncbi:MAG: single-stranded DNA-binding protein, partial [Patescibacteria group bacterium]|nr:single-stranded DNA-binding protein [Patescibacteria group bacterium]